jgi:hypothetical protein
MALAEPKPCRALVGSLNRSCTGFRDKCLQRLWDKSPTYEPFLEG